MIKTIIKKINFNNLKDVKNFLDKHHDKLDNLFVNHLGETYLIYQSDTEVENVEVDSELEIYHIRDKRFYNLNEVVTHPEQIPYLVPNRLLIETLKNFIKKASYSVSINCPILATEINIPLMNIKSGYSYDNNYQTMDAMFSSKKDSLSAITVLSSEDYRLNEALLQLILVQHEKNEEIQQRMKDSIKNFSQDKNFLLLLEKNKKYYTETFLKIFLLLVNPCLIYFISNGLSSCVSSREIRVGLLFCFIAPYYYFLTTLSFNKPIELVILHEKIDSLKACIREQNCLYTLLATMKNFSEKQNITSSHLDTHGVFNTMRQRALPAVQSQSNLQIAFRHA